MENIIYDLMNSGIAVELMVPSRKDSCTDVGIRLRTYGRDLPKNRMVIAGAPTFEEALAQAVEKAENGRWENLNWAARPWAVGDLGGGNRYGL